MPDPPSTPSDDGHPPQRGEPTEPRESRKHTLADAGGSEFTHGRFEPGDRLGSRYRIVAMLGQGGMGEVYRADDLELGQSVALKFLPERVATDPTWLRRFRNEVRTARQVAHPNVCRIHDIGEEDGHVFLSMEYVDGEDLAGVLRRLGRPSREKAIEIAQQMCLGLAAAHENKVLHRDLKPANIMIDGRGRVRITDFGLAGFFDDLDQTEAWAGTPAYMAPEQLTQGRVSVRSDLYTLGLILHELFTGRCVFDTDDIDELKRRHSSGSVTSPSSISAEIDPAVERVIMRCLQEEPEQRPQSAYQVLAALPGGDPLAAALAAGETPSPELVASARDAGGLRPLPAIGLFVALIASLGVAFLVPYGRKILPERSPAVLSVVTQQILEELGYTDLPRNSVSGYTVNAGLAASLRTSPMGPGELADLAWPPRYRYWRRWSRGAFTSINFHFPENFAIDGPTDMPSDTATVAVDSTGRLLSLTIPSSFAGDATTPPAEVDWSPIFARARLDPSDATPIESPVTPPVFCDRVTAWEIEDGDGRGGPLTVVMGAEAGRPTYFEILGPGIMLPLHPVDPKVQVDGIIQKLVLLFLAGLAWRNVRTRRTDGRNALICALFTGGLYALMELLSIAVGGSNGPFRLAEMTGGRAGGHILLHAGQAWLLYIAVEPYVRRLWPRMLVGVIRLLSGRLRDPAVGRELLIGLACGCVAVALCMLTWYGQWRGVTDDIADLSFWTFLPSVHSPGHFISNRAHFVAWAVLDTAFLVGVLVILRLIVRHPVATLGLGILWIGLSNYGWYVFFGGYSTWVAVVFAVAFGVGVTLLSTRVGVLATILFIFIMRSSDVFVLELDSWTTPYSLIWLVGLLGLAAYGFWISLAGRPLFKDLLAEPR